MTADELAGNVGKVAAEELADAFSRVKNCLDQLDERQIWFRTAESMNSIGNLILHLCGNLRQWIVAGLSGEVDTRNRPAEFAERGPVSKHELLGKLETTVSEAKAVLMRQTAGQLMAERRVQGSNVTGLKAIFDSIPHFRGHTQEIVHLTRLQLGERYKFQWQPLTREQGAPD